MPKTDISENASYDPQKTPDIIYGLLLLGLNNKKVAELLDVALETLTEWLAIHPELAELNDRVICADAAVLTALHEAAITKPQLGRKMTPRIRPLPPTSELWINTVKSASTIPSQTTPNPSNEQRRELANEVYRQIRKEIPVTIKAS